MQKRLTIWLLLPLLAACQGNDVRNALGLEREAPDEFVVYSRPPLSLPPEFELRPPRPGEPPRDSRNTREAARAALLGERSASGVANQTLSLDNAPLVDTAVTPVLSGDAKSAADSNFLNRSGVYAADPDIRQKLQASDGPSTSNAKTLFDKIIKSEGEEPLVDATKEVERLRKNKQEGNPVTEGEVPTIDSSPETVIDKLF